MRGAICARASAMVYQREKVLGGAQQTRRGRDRRYWRSPGARITPRSAMRICPHSFARLDVQDLDATTSLGLEGLIRHLLRSTSCVCPVGGSIG